MDSNATSYKRGAGPRLEEEPGLFLGVRASLVQPCGCQSGQESPSCSYQVSAPAGPQLPGVEAVGVEGLGFEVWGSGVGV